MDELIAAIQFKFNTILGDEEQVKKIKKGALAVCGGYVGLKFLRYLYWKRNVNKAIPGPDGDWESAKELYAADLGDFWGFNSTLLSNLHKKYGKVVKLWLGGQLYVSFIDCEDIEVANKNAIGRPPLTENLLPYLGKKNLLFQKTGHDNGVFVKSLRLKYGSMVQGDQPLDDVHRVTFEIFGNKTAQWGTGAPINVFEELKYVLYDIMGTVLFGGAWSANSNGAKIVKVHRHLIEGSSTLGLSFLNSLTIGNLLALPSDYMKYQGYIKDFHGLCWSMIEQRRQEVKENPGKWANDRSALTMLVTEKDDKTGKPYFDKVLAISTCAGFLNGAYDTTHISVFWLLYNLAANPAEQKKLQAEIDAEFGKLGKEQPTFEKCRHLKRLHATIQESIRLRVTVPLGMRGNYRQDVDIGKYTIPKDATILPFTDGAHKDPVYFGADVDKFRPDRFIGDSAEALKARKAFHGFGGGARMCVGFKFAEAELKAILTFLMQRYTVELVDPNMAKPVMVFEAGVNAPKEKFNFIFKQR